MSDTDLCPECGGVRAAGVCPRCLIRLGLGGPGPCNPASFDLGETRFDSGVSAGASVLESLALTAGPMPRVLLRDSELFNGPGPIVQPGSGEMPGAGERAGKLQVFGEIARGGMGAVLKGRDPDLGRDLAIKVLLEKHGDDPGLTRRFVEEAQIAGQLQHPGVVPIYELGTFADRRPYFAMKLVKGHTLAEVMAGRERPSDDHPRLVSIFLSIAQTMAYAHARGVIHRDLKPSNVMVGSFGEVQVMDWGLAKVVTRGGAADDRDAGKLEVHETIIATARSGSGSDQGLELSRAGSVLGTPAYMAPEQARGENDRLDERADVFALGSILCEILTGRPAFAGRTSVEILRKAAKGDVGEAQARLEGSGVDVELVAIARNAIAPELEDRPREAKVVVDLLQSHLAGVQERLRATELARAAAAARAIEEEKRRRVTVALAASLLSLAGLVAGGWAWTAARKAQRGAVTAREVNTALTEAAELHGRARATPDDQVAPLELALAVAKRGSSLLAGGEGDAELQSRVVRLIAALTQERDEAKVRSADRVMTDRLKAIYASFNDNRDLARVTSDYTRAFRSYGIPFDSLTPADAGARVATRSIASVLIDHIDHWIFCLIVYPGGERDVDRIALPRLVSVANVADSDPWRLELRKALVASDDPTFIRLADTADLDRLSLQGAVRLAYVLRHRLNEYERAIKLLKAVLGRHRNDLWLNHDLAQTLRGARPARWEEALRYLSAAVAIEPGNLYMRKELGWFLTQNGNLDEARAVYREAALINPADPGIYIGLASILQTQGKPDEAIDLLREAIRLDPTKVDLRFTIADIQRSQGKAAEATATVRETVLPDQSSAGKHYHLALALERHGQLDEAIVQFREAVRIDHDHLGFALWELARCLRKQEKFDEAIAIYRRIPTFKDVPVHDFSLAASRLKETEAERRLVATFDDIITGVLQAKDAAENLAVAQICTRRQQHAASARFSAEAFTSDPKLAEDTKSYNRYNAACSAALAGSGQGGDAPADEASRALLRTQSLTWLRADLAARTRKLDEGSIEDRGQMAQDLNHWRSDPDLVGVRAVASLAKLPEAERKAWQHLWADVDAQNGKLTVPKP